MNGPKIEAAVTQVEAGTEGMMGNRRGGSTTTVALNS